VLSRSAIKHHQLSAYGDDNKKSNIFITAAIPVQTLVSWFCSLLVIFSVVRLRLGNENQTVSPQSILPDLKGFSFVGTTMENGVNTSRWMMKVNNGAKTSKYTMMVNADSGAPIR